MKKKYLYIGLVVLFLFGIAPVQMSRASGIQLVVNGTDTHLTPVPLLVEGRTLVPLRPLFEYLDATVTWQDGTGIVTATRGDRYIRFTVGERFACLDVNCEKGALMDVPSQLINYRTYIPIRFISTALGAKVDWDANTPAVLVDTTVSPVDFPVRIINLPTTIKSETTIQIASEYQTIESMKIYLLDKKSIKGPIVSLGTEPNGFYTFKPDPSLNGDRYMVAVVEEPDGKKNYSPLLPVTVAVDQNVKLTGVTDGEMIQNAVTLNTPLSFTAAYTEYQILDPSTGSGTLLGYSDPDKPFTYYPLTEQNGARQLVSLVYDRTGKNVSTLPVPVTVSASPTVAAIIPTGDITRSLSFTVTANFKVEKFELSLDNSVVQSYGGSSPVRLPQESDKQKAFITFTPDFDQNGVHQLKLRSYDTTGILHETDLGSIRIATNPYVELNIGPDQVISKPYTLKIKSNIPVTHFVLLETDAVTGDSYTIAVLDDPLSGFDYIPPADTNKKVLLSVQAEDGKGNVYQSDPVQVHIVTTKTYGATPFGTKEDFRPLIEPLALSVMKQDNMSASLQVAQAILESGWGQYLPTDKYTGFVSNNLFGIKGTGPAGTVTSSTSEVYSGLRYTIDANFRAYHTIEESWRDHANLLLLKSWYAPFRSVMYDPVEGAWGLYRSGYATTPTYAIQLIHLMEQQQLWVLDNVIP